MKEYGVYSRITGGLIVGLGLCEDENEAREIAEYYSVRDGIDYLENAYISERLQ